MVAMEEEVAATRKRRKRHGDFMMGGGVGSKVEEVEKGRENTKRE